MSILTNLTYFIFIIILISSCNSDSKNTDQRNKKGNSDTLENKKFLTVSIKNLRIRTTPDLEGAVLERLPERAILEYMFDSTTFTTPLKLNGKNYDLPWYKVKSENGNIGWIYGACIEFLSEDENKRILSLREDALLGNEKSESKKNKSLKSNRESQKFDEDLFNQYRAGLYKISYTDPAAVSSAFTLFENMFKTESVTADKAFAEFLQFHTKVLDYYHSEVNVSKYQFMVSEIKNYGTPNMDYDATTVQLAENGITFGIRKEGKLFLKQNTDFLLRKFLRIVSDPMQQFLEQYALEDEKKILEDGKIEIPIIELASYVVFWDKFLTRNPNFTLKEKVVEVRKKYAVLLLNGAPKSLVFMDGKLNKSYKEAYEVLTSRMGSSPFIMNMKDYYKILEKDKFKDSASLEKIKSQILEKL